MEFKKFISEDGFLSYAWQLNNNQPRAKLYPYLVKKRGITEKQFDVSLTGKSNEYRGVAVTEFILKLVNRAYPESACVRMKEMSENSTKGNGWLIRNITVESELGNAVNENSNESLTFESISKGFEQQVKESMKLMPGELSKLSLSYPTKPERVVVETTLFRRNPAVVVEVLRRAAGKCEGCGAMGPFKRRTDGSLYLEVHHEVTLADGGKDVVENAVALCPNCHRQRHHG